MPRNALKDILSDAFLVANVDAVAPLLFTREGGEARRCGAPANRSRGSGGVALPRWPFWLRAARNLAFTLLLFVTLLRRLFPPY